MLENLKPVAHIRSCKVRTIKEGLSESDTKLLDQYLADSQKWTPHVLAKALGSKGLKIDHRQIMSHRDRTCTCRELGL
jgi:hypothetical protein